MSDNNQISDGKNASKIKISTLPSVNEAAAIAVTILEDIDPKLSVQEQAFFVAGFQECVKYLHDLNEL